MRRPVKPASHEFLALVWQQPLVAIPFTLFFGVMWARDPAGWLLVYKTSLVFSYCIRLGLMAVTYVILPRLAPRFVEVQIAETGFPTRSLWYAGAALLSSYAAGIVVHVWLMPGFLGGPRQIAITGMFALLFTVLFSGLGYARAFYHQSLDRARAVEQARAALAEAELTALRARINPHFLFNTLNTIAALIAENPPAAEETTTRLAEAFRYTLAASERSHARLGDELEFVRNCLAIERTRFGDRLRVEERIEKGVEEIRVPALLLQPLVENAVLHGVGARARGATIAITARRDGDRLLLEVADDGPGFEPRDHATGDGFGLRSVRERLALAGPPHAFEIVSSPGRGTRALITLPLSPEQPVRSVPESKGDPTCFE
jgi:signal transduction histidine kinase